MNYKLFKTKTCAYCPMVEKYLKSKQVPYNPVLVDEDIDTRNWLHKLTGMTTVPILVKYEGEKVVGYVVGWNVGKMAELVG